MVDPSPFLEGPAVLPADFTITVPDATPFSEYAGVLAISDINDNLLGTQDFTVTVTPEPSPTWLVGVPVLAAAARRILAARRLRKRGQDDIADASHIKPVAAFAARR
jgi:hypothetical protein